MTYFSKEILNNAPSSKLKLPLPMVAMTTSLILIEHYQVIVGGLYNTYKFGIGKSRLTKPYHLSPFIVSMSPSQTISYQGSIQGAGGIPGPPPEIFQLSVVIIVLSQV